MSNQEDCVHVILAYDYDYVYRVEKNHVVVSESPKLDGESKAK
jgi:hypothetical protein